MACWWHCEPRRRRCVRYAVLSEPTWWFVAGSEQLGEWINGLSAVVIVVWEACPVATSSLKAWRDLIKSAAAVIGQHDASSACVLCEPRAASHEQLRRKAVQPSSPTAWITTTAELAEVVVITQYPAFGTSD